MCIDFASPFKRTYNKVGSSRQIVTYIEHENLKRIEQGIYTEGFFYQIENNIYKAKEMKEIYANIWQLLKRMPNFMLFMSYHQK
jgi:hypothetical protein